MNAVDPGAFEFAVGKITDGFVFERFAQDYLGSVVGYTFIPAGGLKDRGIDGFEHAFTPTGLTRNLYQISIDQNPEAKLESSLEKLTNNQIQFESLIFVTNRVFKDQERTVDGLISKFGKPIRVFDVHWLASKVNSSEGSLRAYHTFVTSYLHEFSQPGKSYVVGDLVQDPRLFVFLRQQWDANRHDLQLDKILADTLILYSLEGTDPDKKIFKTQKEIRAGIAERIKFEPKLISELIDERLKILCQRPRKVNHHPKEDAYCLPYETRIEIENRNLKDAALYEAFKTEASETLEGYLGAADVRVQDSLRLMEATFNQLFYQQGLEFSNFVLNGQNQGAFEKHLPDVISNVVGESGVVLKNKERVKTCLLIAIRRIVYNGSPRAKQFIRSLSNTYTMLFLLQCDPKLATFFATMASKLNVYVCTSIIIPALSEIYLEPHNRRHWNLLKGAANKGVRLVVNQHIIEELASHFRMIKKHYEDFYEKAEHIYLEDEAQTMYVDDIMIRAYFYAKRQKRVGCFGDFLDNFVSPGMGQPDEDITEWLKVEFGINFVSNESLHIRIDKREEDLLHETLKSDKWNEKRSRTDAKIILAIYALRKMRNENDKSGIFGYQTWWLSKDTTTQRAVNRVFKDKYRVSCYIRPDFLYNYISLSPSKSEIDAIYDELFPSLLGVNISFHLPRDLIEFVEQTIREHSGKNIARLTGILRELGERIKVDPNCRTRAFVQHYFDDKLKKFPAKAGVVVLANPVISRERQQHPRKRPPKGTGWA